MKSVSLQNNDLYLTFPYDPTTLQQVRQLYGRKFLKEQRQWVAPLSVYNVKVLTAAGFPIPDEVRVKLASEEGLKNDLNALSKAQEAEFDTQLPLLPFQKAGAKFLDLAGSGLLGFEVGLGKSITALAITEKNKGKSLIICPAILKWQWQQEILKWIPTAKVFVVDGTRSERESIYNQCVPVEDCYIIINYELLLRDFDSLLRL